MVVGQQDPVGPQGLLQQRRTGVDELVRRPNPGIVRVGLDDGAIGVAQAEAALAEPVYADAVRGYPEILEGVHGGGLPVTG